MMKFDLSTVDAMPMKKWRCSRGHEWESPVEIIGLQFMAYDDLGIEGFDGCMRCLYEHARNYLGRVKEVK